MNPKLRFFISDKKNKEIYFCKETASKRRHKFKKSGTEVTILNTDWLEEKLFDYTTNSEENIFYARREENPTQVKIKVPVYVILYRNICYAVCFTMKDKKKVLRRCREMESSGCSNFSSNETDPHSLVKDMQNEETQTSYTGYPWPLVAP